MFLEGVVRGSEARSLLVIGAGYVGLETALDAKREGWKVYALARSERKKAFLETCGIIPLTGDLTLPGQLPDFPEVDRVLFSAAPDGSSEMEYEKIYVLGMKAVLSRLTRAEKILWISSTSVWGDGVEGVVDENVMPAPSRQKGKLLLEAEAAILSSRFSALVLRLSGIYGPGRNRAAAFQQGRWPEPETALKFMNMIHQADIVRAVDFLFDRGMPGDVYLGTDCEPVTNKSVAEWLNANLERKQPLPEFLGAAPKGKRCSSSKLRALGFTFKYPSFRNGYEEILKNL